MGAHGGSASNLPVEHLLRAVHPADQLTQQAAHFILRHGGGNFQHRGAAVDAVDVLLQGKGNVVAGVGGIVDAVAEIAASVVYGDGHLFNRSDFSIIIGDVFHV